MLFVVAVTERLCCTARLCDRVCSHTQKSGATLVCLPQPEPVTARPTEFAIPRAQDCQSGERERDREKQRGGLYRSSRVLSAVRSGPALVFPVSPADRVGLQPGLPQSVVQIFSNWGRVAGGVGAGGATQVTRSALSLVSLSNQWSKFSLKLEKIKLQNSQFPPQKLRLTRKREGHSQTILHTLFVLELNNWIGFATLFFYRTVQSLPLSLSKIFCSMPNI